VDEIHLSGREHLGQHAIRDARIGLNQRGLIETLAFVRINLQCREIFDDLGGNFRGCIDLSHSSLPPFRG